MGKPFSIEVDEREVVKWLTKARKKQLPFAIAMGLTETAFGVRKVTQRYMRKTFSKPVPFTLNSVLVKKANKRDRPIHSKVFLKDTVKGKGTPPAEYLSSQIEGTPRHLKKFEAWLKGAGYLPDGWFVVPSKFVKVNKSGNISPANLKKMLSALEAGDPKYFVTRKDTKGMPGLYERLRKGVRPRLIFVKSEPSYKITFPFHTIAERAARKRAHKAIAKHFGRAMATAR